MVFLMNPFAMDDNLFWPGNTGWFDADFGDGCTRPVQSQFEPMWLDEEFYRQPCRRGARDRNNFYNWRDVPSQRPAFNADNDDNDEDDEGYYSRGQRGGSVPHQMLYSNSLPHYGHPRGHQGQPWYQGNQQGRGQSRGRGRGGARQPQREVNKIQPAKQQDKTRGPQLPQYQQHSLHAGSGAAEDHNQHQRVHQQKARRSQKDHEPSSSKNNEKTATLRSPYPPGGNESNSKPVGVVHPVTNDNGQMGVVENPPLVEEKPVKISTGSSEDMTKGDAAMEATSEIDTSNTSNSDAIKDFPIHPPPVKKQLSPVERLEATAKELGELEKRVDAFVGQKSDREFIVVDEMLTKALLALDAVEVNGEEELRARRRELVRWAQTLAGRLEEKVSIGLVTNVTDVTDSNVTDVTDSDVTESVTNVTDSDHAEEKDVKSM